MGNLNFFFYGVPAEYSRLCDVVFEKGMRFVAVPTVRRRPVEFSDWSPALVEHLVAHDYLFISGTFTAEIRLAGSRGSHVSDQSGPLLGLRLPKVRCGARLLDAQDAYDKRPAGSLEFYPGLLHAFSEYHDFAPPSRTARDFEAEARTAHRELVKALKAILVSQGGRWISPTAREWATAGSSIFI